MRNNGWKAGVENSSLAMMLPFLWEGMTAGPYVLVLQQCTNVTPTNQAMLP